MGKIMKKITTSILIFLIIILSVGCGTFGGHVPKDPYEDGHVPKNPYEKEKENKEKEEEGNKSASKNIRS
jgi:hypothetical protein